MEINLHIEQYNNNGIPYLRLCRNVPGVNAKGNRVYKKKTVLNIGSFSKFDDGKPDYLERLRQSFREGKPFIDTLLPYVEDKAGQTPVAISLDFEQGSDFCIGKPKLFSHVIFDHVFRTLELSQFFTLHKSRSGIEYDLLGLVKLMCYGRILNPASKFSTFHQKDDYYDNLCKSDNPFSIYRTLDVIYQRRSAILKRMNNAITKTIGRNTDLVFYDVTNFYFEIDEADEDEVIDGETEKGLRQRGISKENKKSPIVQMGLFMDANGIPISFDTFAGNTLDQATLRIAMKKTVDNFELSRFVLVSDRGIISGPNIAHIMKSGHGYIMSKSIKKTAKPERKWILEEDGYIHESDKFKYKSRIVKRTITDEDGNKHKIKQKVVVYWSQKFYKKEYKEHQSFLEFVEAFKENPANFRVAKTQQGYLKKFMKKEFMIEQTGELIHGNDLVGFVDEDKLEKHTAFMGYYQIISSELEMDELEIINKYHQLAQIEDQFKIMKSTLHTRPMYVKNRTHIEAHLTVCLIALIMVKLIQYMVNQKYRSEKHDDLLWCDGLPANRLQTALNKFQIDELAQGYYRFNHIDDPDISLLLDAFDLNIEKKLYTAGELKSLKRNLKDFQ